ncbi:hypothetical protein FRB94_014600 [Tulasnella sp. JGI-2019a]|nr:hypothetical protein FRB93_002833 [Tulasnella sp. JGI-2019a]KAG9007127.1 hypothetical protein FRB94_014600 [Tulasnella sp. JGI-2019a]KAG9036716.1 hypothetical protein FRB95_008047 [Tulasnella sp. JGI-2019a]
MWSWSSHQTSLDLGQAFTWAEGSFLSLETLSFITSLADAGEVMGKGHQSRLRSLRIVCRTPAQYPQLQSLSSKLSAAPLHLTSIALFIYSQDFVAKTSGGLPFDCIHPLLHCTTLYSLLLGHNMPIMYSEDDIMTMGKAWPAMEALMLCADPVDTVGYSLGRPLRSIGVFADHFPHLTLLGIYVNTFEIPSDSQEHTRFRVLGVLDIGTSPDAAEVHLPLSVYLGKVLTAKTVLKSGRSVEHTRALPKTPASTTEYARRAASWASLASDLRAVQASNLATGVQALAAEDDSLLKEL